VSLPRKGAGTRGPHLHRVPRGHGGHRAQQEAALRSRVPSALPSVSCCSSTQHRRDGAMPAKPAAKRGTLLSWCHSLPIAFTSMHVHVGLAFALWAGQHGVQHCTVGLCRSWLERQQNCPICRTSVFAERPQASPQPGQQQQQPQQPEVQPAAPGAAAAGRQHPHQHQPRQVWLLWMNVIGC